MTAEVPKTITNYLSHLEAIGRAPVTIERYLSDIRVFLSWVQRTKGNENDLNLSSLKDLDCMQYIQYLERRNYSDATIRRLTSVLNGLLKHHGINSLYLKTVSKNRPLRDLTDDDFISIKDYKKLIRSVNTRSEAPEKPARDYLNERNTCILHLMRSYGLTPIEVSEISMNEINLAQQKVAIQNRVFVLDRNLVKLCSLYLNVIDKKVRPRFHSDDPLFVAFNNTSMSFQYDYTLGQPKRLSERGIQEMVKDEVQRAGLRKMSSLNLRNQSILESIILEYSDDQIVEMYGLSSPLSLHRYKKYWESESLDTTEK